MQNINTVSEYQRARTIFEHEYKKSVKKTLTETDDDHIKKDSSIFAKIVTEQIKPPYEVINLDKYLILSNMPDKDKNWEIPNDRSVSMSKWHKFIVPTDLSNWRLFNVVSLPATIETINMLEEMKEKMTEYAHSQGIKEVGFFFHCWPTNSVNLLHMHAIDMEHLGPSYALNSYKNLPLDVVLGVLLFEMNSKKSTS